MTRRIAIAACMLLLAAACGGDNAGDTTTSSTAAPTTTASSPTTTTPLPTATTTAATTTTVAGAGSLAGFVDAPVEDPLFGTGFHEMAYGDEAGTYIVSTDSLIGDDPTVDRLAIAMLDPAPTITGIGVGQILVSVGLENPSGDAPTATALYTLNANGWGLYSVIENARLLEFLETTTDYEARRPAGPAVAAARITMFDWVGGTARFTADIAVAAASNPDRIVFSGQVECTVAGEYECLLTSDDGVARPGDEDESVAALQTDLAGIGYFAGDIDGVYDDEMSDAVRLFQRDYRLDQDGRAGPQTVGVLETIVSGDSEVVMASPQGVGGIVFGTDADNARVSLIGIFGAPSDSTGWYEDACDGQQWSKDTWNGFTAIFTNRDGSAQFDGWEVTDVADIPAWLYFVGGIAPDWTWSDLQAFGAGFEPAYGGVWYRNEIGYNNGQFVDPPGDGPASDAAIKGFGTGTGGFVSC